MTGYPSEAREVAVLEFAVESRPPSTVFRPAATSPRPRPPRRQMYAEAGVEPKLEELLSDPLTEALMRRDGVSAASLRQLISTTRKGLRDRATAN